MWRDEQTTDAVGVTSGLGEAFIKHKIKVCKINRGSGVLEGQCSEGKESVAQGAAASSSGFVQLGLRHFLEMKRPGILACSHLTGAVHVQTTGPGARSRLTNSTISFPSCTGKRPVSRGEPRSTFQQRR
ncbi:hypothetical protein M9458_011760, partial [Cirrhinus mrigala]